MTTTRFPVLILAGLAALIWPLRAAAAETIPSRNLQLMAHFNDYPPAPGAPYGAGYASCWSYVHGDGREYAVIGCHDGTAIYNVTNPAATYFVGFIGGTPSLWREMKSYRNWIYVVTEGYTCPPVAGQGLQIIRMTDPEHPVLAATYSLTFNRSHTVSVDTTRAILVCNGTNLTVPGTPYCGQQPSGMRILSLANPESPVEIGSWPGGNNVSTDEYVHDSVPVGSRLYAASIYAHTERVFDFTNPAAPTQMTSWTYDRAFYTHNSWPDKTGRYVFVTDEQNGQTLRAFDLVNPSSPQLVYEWTANPQAIAHNAHVAGDELFVAHYTEGVRILDIHDPAHPAEYAWADTDPGTSGGYHGVWGVCPYFPSGTLIASDMQTGLYVFRPNRNYGVLRTRVVDAATSQPLPGVVVRLTTQGDSLTTPADGLVAFAPNPGSHTVEARQFGRGAISATRVVTGGGVDSVTLALTLKPTVELSGTLHDATTQAPLADGEVTLAYTPVATTSDSTGHYELGAVPDDNYRLEARRAGYAPKIVDRRIGIGADGTQDFYLRPATTWDAFEAPNGWTVGAAGDNATGGVWFLGAPTATGVSAASRSAANSALRSMGSTVSSAVNSAMSSPMSGGDMCGGTHGLSSVPSAGMCPGHGGVLSAMHLTQDDPGGHCGCGSACMCAKSSSALGAIQPAADHTPGAGTQCFFTGPASDTDPDNGDVDGGWTTLTSPALNVASMSDPVIGYWRWFYTNGDANDWLAVSISNNDGASWVPVDTTRGLHDDWQERAIHVATHVAPTNKVRLRFVAADLGPASIVEAAIDDIVTYDGATAPVSADSNELHERLAFRAPRPNPAQGSVELALELPHGGPVTVEVLDLAGRRVRTLRHGTADAGVLRLHWDARDESGHAVGAGVYYARAVGGGEQARAIVAIVR